MNYLFTSVAFHVGLQVLESEQTQEYFTSFIAYTNSIIWGNV